MRTAIHRATFALLLAAAPLLTGGPSSAQTEGTLYARASEDVVKIALEIELEYGWHLYHDELGHPKAVGKPTRVTPSGAGVEWSSVRFPEPHRFDQSEFGDGIFILAHEDAFVLYAVGRVSGSAAEALKGLTVEVDGLACEEEGMCVPYRETLSPEGPGPDALWDEFPADLVPPVAVPKADRIKSGEADASFYVRLAEGQARAAIEFDISPGWHLYHSEKGNPLGIGKPTRIQFMGEGVRWDTPVWPEPEELDQSDIIEGAWIWGHEGTIVVYASGVVEEAAKGRPAEELARGLWLEIDGQTCEEACIPYKETAVYRGAGPAELWEGFPVPEPDPQEGGDGTEPGETGESPGEEIVGEAASAGVVAPASGSGSGEPPLGETEPMGGDSEENAPLGVFLASAVFWGLITLLMPCTYPMIPITISFFTKQAESRGGRVWPLALTYGAGIVLIFVVIGVVVGQVIVPFAVHPVTNLVIGVLFFFFAFVLFGFVRFEPPRFLMNVAGKASMKGGFLGVFLMGTTLVVTSFTCTAPFVGTLLAQGAAGGDLMRVVMGMSVFGLTMAIPFVALSLVPGKLRSIPKSGNWMNTLKVTLGFVELAAAFKFFSNSDLGWEWNVISREFFLALWALIFAGAALYLFGLGSKGQEIGNVRRGSGVLLAVFAVYCGWGMTGKPMDFVMSAMNPPYSGGKLFPVWYEFGGEWEIVKDDYQLAREKALAEDKLLFVNFTGFT